MSGVNEPYDRFVPEIKRLANSYLVQNKATRHHLEFLTNSSSGVYAICAEFEYLINQLTHRYCGAAFGQEERLKSNDIMIEKMYRNGVIQAAVFCYDHNEKLVLHHPIAQMMFDESLSCLKDVNGALRGYAG
ncbi:hypothetical protein [Neptuniibacter sp. QD37_11]|uniref:hypothetical protein n=1 Tax=Neptuniibacter sp. QD37_11 TaxID=3398209 RepID=UPI0039F4B6B3